MIRWLVAILIGVVGAYAAPELLHVQSQREGIILVFDTPFSGVKVQKSEDRAHHRYEYRLLLRARYSHPAFMTHTKTHQIGVYPRTRDRVDLIIRDDIPLSITHRSEGKTLEVRINASQSLQSSYNPQGKIIVIDPGHGGKDGGAQVGSRLEKVIVLSLATQLSRRLRALGYVVYMTRETDRFIPLRDRTNFANAKKANLFLSIHTNSIPKSSIHTDMNGIETYFLSPAQSERAVSVAASENIEGVNQMGQAGKLDFLTFLNSEKIIASHKLGIDIQRAMVLSLRQRYTHVIDNGVRKAPFWVLVGAQMPAVLIEVGYISHPREGVRLRDAAYQRQMVEGMAQGVVHYFERNP